MPKVRTHKIKKMQCTVGMLRVFILKYQVIDIYFFLHSTRKLLVMIYSCSGGGGTPQKTQRIAEFFQI